MIHTPPRAPPPHFVVESFKHIRTSVHTTITYSPATTPPLTTGTTTSSPSMAQTYDGEDTIPQHHENGGGGGAGGLFHSQSPLHAPDYSCTIG